MDVLLAAGKHLSPAVSPCWIKAQLYPPSSFSALVPFLQASAKTASYGKFCRLNLLSGRPAELLMN